MTEDDLLRQEAQRRGISVTTLKMLNAVPDNLMRDIVEDGRRPSPMKPASPLGDDSASRMSKRGTGWLDERPLRSPNGVNLIDQMCEAQTARDKLKEISEAMEFKESLERDEAKRNAELDPTNSGTWEKDK